MPKFSVWGARLALLYFLLGFTLGALMLINKAEPFAPALWSGLPLHIEFLFMGWVVQLVFAIGYWIFPRFKFEPKRGQPIFGWSALGLLNLGIGLVAWGYLAAQANRLFLGRLLEVAAVLIFGVALWMRTKPTETGQQAQAG